MKYMVSCEHRVNISRSLTASSSLTSRMKTPSPPSRVGLLR